jgi:hypothetical protein
MCLYTFLLQKTKELVLSTFKRIRICCLVLLGLIGLTSNAAICQAEFSLFKQRMQSEGDQVYASIDQAVQTSLQYIRDGIVGYIGLRIPSNSIDKAKDLDYLNQISNLVPNGTEQDKNIEFLRCVAREQANTIRASGGGNVVRATPTPSPSRQPSRADIENSDEFKRLETAGDLAKMRGENAQEQADRERQGKKKTHKPGAEAHQCISVVTEKTNFGRLKNNCSYDVNFRMCNYRPNPKSWGAGYDCEKSNIKSTGAFMPFGSIKANEEYSVHLLNTEKNYWFACRLPARVADAEFVTNRGITGRCYAE